jgi:hypothetical protein
MSRRWAAGMTATLFSLDASQWGAFAFGLFLAAIIYCTAYIVRLPTISLAGVDLSVKKSKVGRLVVPVTALTTETLLVFSLTVYLSLLEMRQSPDPQKTEDHFFDTDRFPNDAIVKAGVAEASITIGGYDGSSHARLLVNHRVVFDTSFNCRLKYQCVTPDESRRAKSALADAGHVVGCLIRECLTLDGKSMPLGFPAISVERRTTFNESTFDQTCKGQITLASAKTLRSCSDPNPSWSKALRRVNWQGGIETGPSPLPHTFDLKPFLRRGRNVVEITSENSGIGNCTLNVALAVVTVDGKPYSQHFKIAGSKRFMARLRQANAASSKEVQRDSYATCGRFKIVLPVSQASTL